MFVNIISFIISLCIFIFFNIMYNNISSIDFSQETKGLNEVLANKIILNDNEISNIVNNNTKENITKSVEVEKSVSKKEWKIEIKSIGLSAKISEGTTDNVMNKYVGHFENTAKKKGNVGLAAHNRGYPVNYFQDIKKLKKGDEIKYTYGNFKKTYIVDVIEIIKDTDWKCLEKTEENRITLITCVENEPNYRRCIQGIEK